MIKPVAQQRLFCTFWQLFKADTNIMVILDSQGFKIRGASSIFEISAPLHFLILRAILELWKNSTDFEPCLSLDASYVINGDGSTKSAAVIIAPDGINDYTNYAMSAVVADQLYIFGGYVDYRKVSFIFFFQFFIIFQDRQTWWMHVHPVVRHTQSWLQWRSRGFSDWKRVKRCLSIWNLFSYFLALICFGNTSPYNYCNIFDGVSVATTHSSAYSHRYGGLALYDGQPTTVGSYESNGYRKVETLTETGWQELADFSK